MSSYALDLKRRLGAFLRGIDERTPACSTNTQFLLQLSGYRWAAKKFGPLGGRWVLDGATGTGFGAEALANEGAKVVGIDIDGKAVAEARWQYPRPRFLCMDVSTLGFREATFDLMISQDTLEHVADDARFVQEVYRILKEGGIFLVFTPHAPFHTTQPANPYHLREYSRDSLGELLARFFPSIRVYGRRPGAAIREVETHLSQVRWLDPLGFRRLLFPRFLRHRVAEWVLRRRGSRGLEELSVDEIEYFEGAEGSGTLIAVCRKGGS